MWDSMSVDWFSLYKDKLILRSKMTRSYVSLEMYDSHFVSRGELGDFTVTHVPVYPHPERALLSLVRPETDSYLFKFFIRSYDDADIETFPGYYTQIEFHLNAVKLMVVRSVLMRFWSYIFDAFIPGITGNLISHRVVVRSATTPTSAVATSLLKNVEGGEDDDFKSVSGESSSDDDDFSMEGLVISVLETQTKAADSSDASPKSSTENGRRQYSLNVHIDSLILEAPLAATVSAGHSSVELRQLVIKNRPHQSSDLPDIIDFDLTEAKMNVSGRNIFSNLRLEAELVRGEIIRVITTIGRSSGFVPLNLDREQFSYLCDLLFYNISANAWDGIVDSTAPDVTTPDDDSSITTPARDEWINFEFIIPQLNLSIEEGALCKLDIANLRMLIRRFESGKMMMEFGSDKLILVEPPNGPAAAVPAAGIISECKSINLELESTAVIRSISVSVESPIYWINIGTLMKLRSFFFDDFPGYNRPVGEIFFPPEFQHATGSPSSSPIGAQETVMNVSLKGGRVFLPTANNGGDNKFSISSNLISYHQNFVPITNTFLRKIVLSNASIAFGDEVPQASPQVIDQNSTFVTSPTENKMIMKNLDIFYSSLASESIAYKLNCEPIDLRVGFTHLGELMRGIEIQRKFIDESTTPSLLSPGIHSPRRTSFVRPSDPAPSNPPFEVYNKVSVDIMFHSIGLLIVNDFANYQNTPLINIDVVNLQYSGETVWTAETGHSKRVMTSVNFDIAMSVFNKSAVEWEPLIESTPDAAATATTETITNDKFVKFHIKKNTVTSISEETSQVSLDINNGTGGLQLNLTDNLLCVFGENITHWSSSMFESSVSGHSKTTTEFSSGGQSIFYSPYSVRNMTGEESISVSWTDDPGEVYVVLNREEVQLTGVSVQVGSDHRRRVLAKIFSINPPWSVPRTPLDRQGVYLFKIPVGEGRIADLVADVIVTRDGKKILSIQSSVLVVNEFGFPLNLKIGNNSTGDGYHVRLNPGETAPIPLIHTTGGGLFRLKPDDVSGEDAGWSGAVSIDDIRARTDMKLWQINSASGGTTRIMYLSGRIREIQFQDKSCSQLMITVYAPIRIKSTIPALLNYSLYTLGGPGGHSRRSGYHLASEGVISMNDREFITTVPLTTRVELGLSMGSEGGVTCRDRAQIWPVNPEEVEHHDPVAGTSSGGGGSRQFFLPLKLEDSRGNYLMLRVYFDQISGKPPEVTIHTPIWLQCIDIPTQLKFAYDEEGILAMSDGGGIFGAISAAAYMGTGGDNWVINTGMADRTYVVPLDSRATRIAALLNNTRSEFVSTDTIGSSGTITLDAVDEKLKCRVKQELAVRVSSVPSGVVRDLPVKTTTVSPKYIIVNTLKSPIQVRQGNVNNAVGSPPNHVSVGPGDQVPFKWWILGEDGNISRFLQVREKVSATMSPRKWSGVINVAEIGESLVRGGLDNVRVEIRIYHGGFFIVFSATVEDEIPTSPVATTTPPVTSANTVYRLLVPALNISLAGPSSSSSSDRCELVFLSITNFIVTLSLSPAAANEVDIRMSAIQMDDYRPDSKFPVILNRTRRPAKLGNSSGSSTPPPEGIV